MKNRVRISDVAKMVGVSPTTISHALSGKRPVGEEMKQRIFDAVKLLDYRPNFFAGAIRQQRTMLVGVLVKDCVSSATTMLLETIEHELSRHNYEILLGISGLDVEKGRHLMKKFSSGMVDGVINMLPQISNTEAIQLCGSTPVITHLRCPESPIYIDYEDGARQALDYLWGLGHRRIGLIASRTRHYLAVDPVLTAYRNFMAAHNVPPSPDLEFSGNDTTAEGRAITELLLNWNVTAVFAANDQMAVGAYQAAYARGMKLPEELSVIGYDDSPLATAVYPSLTTVQQPLREIARYTVEAFLNCLESGAPQQTRVVVPRLIVRDSVAAPPKTKQ